MTQNLSKKYSNFFAPKNQIIINGEDILKKYGITTSTITVEEASLPVSNRPVCSLAYGSTLLSFTSIVTTEIPTSKSQPIAKSPTLRTSTNNMVCVAESIGLPEIRPGAKVVLAGLGSKFNHTYRVEKVVHSLDNCGYRTKFEARAQL